MTRKITITKKAKLLIEDKYNIGNNTCEMVIWELPKKAAKRPHGFKYRLYYGNEKGNCLLRYDNEQGKGDHIHYGRYEQKYTFISVEQLIKDFFYDIKKISDKT